MGVERWECRGNFISSPCLVRRTYHFYSPLGLRHKDHSYILILPYLVYNICLRPICTLVKEELWNKVSRVSLTYFHHVLKSWTLTLYVQECNPDWSVYWAGCLLFLFVPQPLSGGSSSRLGFLKGGGRFLPGNPHVLRFLLHKCTNRS